MASWVNTYNITILNQRKCMLKEQVKASCHAWGSGSIRPKDIYLTNHTLHGKLFSTLLMRCERRRNSRQWPCPWLCHILVLHNMGHCWRWLGRAWVRLEGLGVGRVVVGLIMGRNWTRLTMQGLSLLSWRFLTLCFPFLDLLEVAFQSAFPRDLKDRAATRRNRVQGLLLCPSTQCSLPIINPAGLVSHRHTKVCIQKGYSSSYNTKSTKIRYQQL